jgi:NAD+ diphosphatase
MTGEFGHFCPRCRSPLGSREDGGRSRAACPDAGCGFIHYDNPLPVLAAIVELDGDVILARNRAWTEEWYGLITGFLESGETPEEGILREVKEELNLDGEVAGLVGVYSFFRRNQIIIAYHVRAWGEIRLNEELVDYRRIPPEKLKPWESGTGQAVRDWLERRQAA